MLFRSPMPADAAPVDPLEAPAIVRRATVGESRSSNSLGPGLLKKARGRVGWMALVQLTLAGVLGFGASLVFHQAGFIDLQSLVRQLIAMSLQCAVAGAIWWVARTPRYSDSLVLNLGLAMEVMVCLGGAFVMHMGAYEEHNSIAVMTWTAPMIIFFPLVIPSPPRRVLLVSTIAACTEPLVVFSMWATLPIVPNIEHFLTSMLSPFGAIALAYYASKVLWGLNLEVSRARRLGSYQLEERLEIGRAHV